MKNNIKNSGFTLVETLVAVSIFSVSILGLLAVLSKGIADTNYAKTKVTASYLAQEGIEYMRNLRDTFVLYDATSSQNGWNGPNGFINALTKPQAQCDVGDGCYFDAQSVHYGLSFQPMAALTINHCVESCPPLLYDSATGEYDYVLPGTNSGFTRSIQINHQVGTNEIKISSTVYWNQGSGSYNISFSETLFNWVE